MQRICQIRMNDIPESVKSIPIGSSTLGVELNKISRIIGHQMPEAIAFYAGRIVESTALHALKKSNLEFQSSLDLNLDLLYQWGKLSEGSQAVGNSLRRLGNQARHIKRTIDVAEETTIIGLLQLWIEWYFVNFIQREKLLKDKLFITDWSIQTLPLRLLTIGVSGEINANFITYESTKVLRIDATIACFAGERFIDCNNSLANSFTEQVRLMFPRYHRAAEIRALYCSRNGESEEAVKLLEPLTNWEYVGREAYGILGGAYKNLWMESGNTSFLDNAHQQYMMGARKSPYDYYLLINIAATSFWLGNQELARLMASQVIQILEKFGLSGEKNHQDNLNYWITATLAEANFLSEKYSEAFVLYEKLHTFDKGKGRWARVSKQLQLHLQRSETLKVKEIFYSLTGKSS